VSLEHESKPVAVLGVALLALLSALPITWIAI
jgi:hypothetical protein